MAPLSVLAAIGDELVDLHGQHEHQSLLKADRQLALLDGYAQTETLAEEVRRGVGTLRERAREIEALQKDDRERMRRIEFLRYEVQEIDAAALSPEEEEALQTRLNRMTHAGNVMRVIRSDPWHTGGRRCGYGAGYVAERQSSVGRSC